MALAKWQNIVYYKTIKEGTCVSRTKWYLVYTKCVYYIINIDKITVDHIFFQLNMN